jgi:acetyltransferase-like isoleucine patch superfamily enzyme
MAFLPLRRVPLPDDVDARYEAWLASLDRALDDPATDRNELCRRVLTDIYYPGLVDVDPSTLPPTTRVALDQLDPRNVTLEPEYYRDIDPTLYAGVKPLQWLWEMFDKSPLGENVHLGVRFRRLLATRIFRRCGRNFKAFHFVKFSFGYNLEVGDDVVVHRHVLLDDRGGIEIGDGVSISDFANVYSHTHDIVDGREVYAPRTVLEPGVRITYHATILAGTRVGRDSMVGTGSIVTRDTDPHWVYVGVPARAAKEKPAEARARRRPPTPDPLADGPPADEPEEAGEG